MAEYRPITVTFQNRGLDTKVVADELQMGEFAVLENMTSDQEGALAVRRGTKAILTNTTPLAQIVHTLARLPQDTGWRYAGTGAPARILYRAGAPDISVNFYRPLMAGAVWLDTRRYKVGDLVYPDPSNNHFYRCVKAGVSGGSQPAFATAAQSLTPDGDVIWQESNVSGDPMFSENYAVGIDTRAWIFFSDPIVFLKDTGNVYTGVMQLTGITPPDRAPTTVVDGGGLLNGAEYLWKYVYRESQTGIVSNPSPASDTLAAPAVNNSVDVTVDYSRAANVDFIDIYRQGGADQDFQFVDHIPNIPDSVTDTVVFNDNVADAFLGAAIEIDNDRPPTFRGIVLHNETLFGWGNAGDPPNVVRFSKRVNVEQWPQANKFYVGSGGEQVVRVIEVGDQLYVVTLVQVYRIVGSDASSYYPLSTGFNRGMLNCSFAACQIPGGMALTSNDGIYTYPQGTKLTQAIDPLFHGELADTPDATQDALSARMSRNCLLQFYDNKLYFSFATITATTENNNMGMVFHMIYQRWYQWLTDMQALYVEPDTKAFVGATTNGKIYQLEIGNTDDGALIPFTVQTPFMHLGYPDQDKIWGDLALDIDTGNTEVDLQLIFNNGDFSDAVKPIRCSGRQLLQIPVNTGNSEYALNCQLKLSGIQGLSPLVLYKAIFRVLLEPPRRRTYVTDWSNDGSDLRKIYRTLILDIDTEGYTVTVQVQLDGNASTAVETFHVTTSGRQIVYLGMNKDIFGIKSRLKFAVTPDGLRSSFKLYENRFVTLPQPENPTIWQTEWTDKGYPYDKYWKEIVLEVDTFGADRVLDFELRPASGAAFLAHRVTINTAARSRLTLSLPKDTLGKLGRIIIMGGPTALYSTEYIVQQEPPDVTFIDSLEQLFGWDREKQLKRAWITYKSPVILCMKVYIDEILRTIERIPASTLPSGWEKREVKFPDGIKGRLVRVTFEACSLAFLLGGPGVRRFCPPQTEPNIKTFSLVVESGSRAFKIYWEQSEVEFKPLNPEQGYRRAKFQPPQLM